MISDSNDSSATSLRSVLRNDYADPRTIMSMRTFNSWDYALLFEALIYAVFIVLVALEFSVSAVIV